MNKMPDGNTAALSQYEADNDRAELSYERKLSLFRVDPYSFCEWNIDAFSKYDLLSVALDALLEDFDTEAAVSYGGPNQCARKDILAAIEDSVQKVEP